MTLKHKIMSYFLYLWTFNKLSKCIKELWNNKAA